MNSEIIEKYKRAGEISVKAKKEARKLAVAGETLFNLAEQVENLICDLGGKLAFPINLSLNEIAAHYTPSKNDHIVIKEDDVLKIDLGVHIDGYIADTAITVNPSKKYANLIASAEQALDNAIKAVKPGTEIKEIGAIIQQTIEKNGFKPIKNLGGHYLDQYMPHTGYFIPNIKTNAPGTLNEGDAIAIEPFATTGAGFVKEGKDGNIYRFSGSFVRGKIERQLLKKIIAEYKTMPFTPRWFKDFSDARLGLAISQLIKQNAIQSYPILREANDGIIAQAEHTILVLDKPIVTTL